MCLILSSLMLILALILLGYIWQSTFVRTLECSKDMKAVLMYLSAIKAYDKALTREFGHWFCRARARVQQQAQVQTNLVQRTPIVTHRKARVSLNIPNVASQQLAVIMERYARCALFNKKVSDLYTNILFLKEK